MIETIQQIFWMIFIGFGAYKVYDVVTFILYMERIKGTRFVTVPAHLKFPSDNDSEDEDEYSDPEIRRILKASNIDDKPAKTEKIVNIRYTIDLDTIKAYHEYTTDTAESGSVSLNCTYISFTDRSCVVVELPFDEFDDIVVKYNNQRYHVE